MHIVGKIRGFRANDRKGGCVGIQGVSKAGTLEKRVKVCQKDISGWNRYISGVFHYNKSVWL